MKRHKISRRGFFASTVVGALSAGAAGCHTNKKDRMGMERPPNVILILTDDQGYGDFGCHGNPVIHTPNLDRLHDESVRFKHCYVSPVCSPTRSSLMTGRYNYRTGVVDTYLGRSLMHADEVTIPEVLSSQGYRTGLFGKWHLGDNYPLRAMDQGFQESLVHNGGGMGQPSEPPGSGYFDPVLRHNGVEGKYKGYCTDIFTDATIAFIKENRHRPFFAYLATNAPHSPLVVGEEYVKPYLNAGLDEKTARVYGMITNIDDNVGRLLAALTELDLSRKTIVIFLTDNGPGLSQELPRYNAGLRGLKGTVYDGGIRVPCFIRWPDRLKKGTEVDAIAAHIDLFPTILDACGCSMPKGLHIDGRNLMPLLEGQHAPWPDRTLYFQWHRGDEPELYRNCAARSQHYKLVNGQELYNMDADPGEQHDLATEQPDVVAQMREGYEAWFRDVTSTRGYEPPRIVLGSIHENPATLTRQDWRGAQGWGNQDLGYWEVDVEAAGTYTVRLRFPETKEVQEAGFRLGSAFKTQKLIAGAVVCTFDDVQLSPGPNRLEAWLMSNGKQVGPQYVDIERR